MDRHGCNPDSPWAYNLPSSLSTLVETFDLLDIWRTNHRHDLPIHLNWSSEAITVLGCQIANIVSVNSDPFITKFQNQFTLLKQRQLSFRGHCKRSWPLFVLVSSYCL